MYQFDYNITDNDYIEFNMYHMTHDPEIKKMHLILRFSVLFASLIIIGSKLIYHEFDGSIILITAVLIPASIIFIFAYNKLVLKKSIKKALKKQKKTGKPAYNQEGTITFCEDEIIDKSNTAETKLKYAEVIKLGESDSGVYIYLNSMVAILLPKRLFKNDNELNDFISFLKSKCKNIKA